MHVELTGQGSVGGQLGDQDAVVVASHTVGHEVGREPAASEEAVEFKVSTGFEVRRPSVAFSCGQRHVLHAVVASRWGLIDANGQPAVVSRAWEEVEQQGVDRTCSQAAILILVEARACAQVRWVQLVTSHSRHEVGWAWSGHVQTVRGHASDAVHSVLLHCETEAVLATVAVKGA